MWAAPRLIRPDPALLVPPERAAAIGDRMLIALVERHGPPCAGAAGLTALAALAERLAPGAPPRLRLMPLGVPAAALPGGTILLDDTLGAGPTEVLAGWAALALGRDAPRALLAAAGPVADLRYLASGSFPDDALARAAEAALACPPLRATRPRRSPASPRPASTPGPSPPPSPGAPVAEAPITPPPLPAMDLEDWRALRDPCG